MKFAHLSDCHIGGWREDTLREVNLKSFERAIDFCIDEHVGFIIIAGDLFDTALPSIDILKQTAKILSKLKEYDIPVYIIPGSHDFSASGKTMLDVLENSGLVANVMKFEDNKLQFTIDRTGVKLTGMYGKKGGLETADYERLEKKHLEDEDGFKIFLFHTLLHELKPREFELIDAPSISILPKNFNYYAGGHPHFVYHKHHEDYGTLAYPGPLYPNNFQELEVLKQGGFLIVETNKEELHVKHIPLKIIETVSYYINAENKTPIEVEREILNTVTDYKNKIITLRIEGCLKDGKISDINFKNILENFSEAYYVLKNTNKLTTKEFQELNVDVNNVDDIETLIIKEYSKQSIFDEDKIFDFMNSLDKEKFEGEKNDDFEIRILKDVSKLVGI
ncbi:DNA repair exonuclease [Candidatus Woesearchaeota archaeon]|nr:DNA repair exonuclease [Candidatus Woesearchaeota archaeon]